MTLFKQIALLVSFLLIMLLLTVLTVNFINTSDAVQEGLYEDAKNTASSLSLSLGTTGGDETFMATMINANFDSGHYMKIALYDMENRLIYERIKEQERSEVPQWFISLIHIDIPTASAQVSSGWSPIGILKVRSDSAYAYGLLYDTLRGLLLFFFILAIIGLGLLSMLLHFILKPLKQVQHQAEAILDNEFIIQEKIPFTTEFKHVVNGMNAMVKRVEEIFEKGNKAMRHNHELLYNDPVTKLYNRRYLMMKLPQYINEETVYDIGALIIIAFEGAQEANKAIGHQKVDELFGSLGGVIQSHGDDFKDMLAARLNGTEFALLLPGCEADEAKDIAGQICAASKMMLHHYGLEKEKGFGVFAGAYSYVREDTISDIFANVDYALAQAKLLPLDNAYLHTSEQLDEVMGKDRWREIVQSGIENNRFNLNFWPAVDVRSASLHHYVLSFTLNGEGDTRYSYGQFIAPVISIGLEDDVYLHITEQLLINHPASITGGQVALRIPASLLQSAAFLQRFHNLMALHVHRLDFRLIIEISDMLIVENLEQVKSLTKMLKEYNIRFAISQFTGEAKNYDFLKEIKPLYIQTDLTYLLDQSQQSMASLQIMTDSLGIELMAGGVKSDEELSQLKERHVYTIQGPLAEKLLG